MCRCNPSYSERLTRAQPGLVEFPAHDLIVNIMCSLGSRDPGQQVLKAELESKPAQLNEALRHGNYRRPNSAKIRPSQVVAADSQELSQVPPHRDKASPFECKLTSRHAASARGKTRRGRKRSNNPNKLRPLAAVYSPCESMRTSRNIRIRGDVESYGYEFFCQALTRHESTHRLDKRATSGAYLASCRSMGGRAFMGIPTLLCTRTSPHETVAIAAYRESFHFSLGTPISDLPRSVLLAI